MTGSTAAMLVIGGMWDAHRVLLERGPPLVVMLARSEAKSLPQTLADAYQALYVLPSDIDEDWLVELGVACGRQHGVGRIFSYAELWQLATARMAEQLQLPYHPVETVRAVQDKFHMRQVLAAAGIDQPVSRVLSDRQTLQDYAAGISYPQVIKPRADWGSRKVQVVHTPEQLVRAYAEGFQGGSGDGECLVEGFVRGREYSVECFTEDGEHFPLCVTSKYLLPDSAVEIGHVLPADISPDQRQRLFAFVTRVLDTLGVASGISHTELRVNGADLQIIETHVRVAGDNIYRLLAYATDEDIIELVVRQSLGEPVRAVLERIQPKRHAAVWYACNRHPGTLLAIHGEDAVRDADGVRDMKLSLKENDSMPLTRDSFTRIGRISAVGADFEQALERARSAWRHLRLDLAVTPELPPPVAAGEMSVA